MKPTNIEAHIFKHKTDKEMRGGKSMHEALAIAAMEARQRKERTNNKEMLTDSEELSGSSRIRRF